MRWQTLSIKTPEDTLRPDQARKILAAQTGTDLPPQILHYKKDLHPASGLSPFRFGARRGTVLLHAVGNQACAQLRPSSEMIIAAFESHYGRAIDSQITNGVFNKNRGHLKKFCIPYLILQQHPNVYKRIKDDLQTPECPKATALAEQKIREGIVRQYEDMGMYLEDHEYALYEVKIRGNDHGRFVPIAIKPGVFGLAARNVEFFSDLSFTGPWHVGHLVSRGYGLILPAKGGKRAV
ncbi:type IV CRISPR-associated endonuclease Csf5 [Geoalkalibacter subterraneus]|uniref:CRISPR-associated protein Cas6 n=1 Tax=Geoalkalibacter subterraneus TaxID=483547 RepID=A0A0B5FXA4_9BACT|nr:type IV CRISPR-associated endonuclease Csf5 [Geoalkalibacter subterraneus]AJF08226.1 hypothetical protein GSUB_17220 [Geoalkalibacter subterraneus]